MRDIEGFAPQAKVFLLVLSAKLAVLQLRGEAKQIIVVRKVYAKSGCAFEFAQPSALVICRSEVHAETPLAELVDASADGAKLPQARSQRHAPGVGRAFEGCKFSWHPQLSSEGPPQPSSALSLARSAMPSERKKLVAA